MPTRHQFSPDELQAVRAVMAGARDRDELRRALCVWLPAALGVTMSRTAAALGCSVGYVHKVQKRFARLGASALEDHRQPPLALSQGGEGGLRAQVERAQTAAELRSVLCVWLRVALGLSLPQIARALACPLPFVRAAQQAFLERGDVRSAAPAAPRPSSQAAAGEWDAAPAGGRRLPEAAIAEVQSALKRARSVPEYRTALCVYLYGVLNLGSGRVAQIVGLSFGSVCRIYHRFLAEGPALFRRPGRGGARRRVLTVADEYDLLRELRQSREAGWPYGVLKFPAIHERMEKRAGRPVSRSSVHSFLDRHGWICDALVMAPIQGRTPKDE